MGDFVGLAQQFQAAQTHLSRLQQAGLDGTQDPLLLETIADLERSLHAFLQTPPDLPPPDSPQSGLCRPISGELTLLSPDPDPDPDQPEASQLEASQLEASQLEANQLEANQLEARRLAAEAALAASEARYRLISEMSPIGIFRHDTTGRCTYVNEKTLQLVGQPLEACLDLNWLDTIHPDDRQQAAESWQDFMAQSASDSEVVFRMECRHLHKDQVIVWVWAQVAAERDTAGQLTGYVGTLTDITARKQIESALRESETKYRTLFNEMDEGYATHELILNQAGEPVDYRILEVNAQFEQLTGLSRAEALSGITVCQMIPELEDYWVQTYGKVALTGEPVRFEHCVEAWGRWYDVYAFRIGDPEKHHFATLYSEITARKQMELNLHLSEEQRRLALELTNTASWGWHLETNEVVWSDNMFGLLGLPPSSEPMSYETWKSCVYPEDLPRLEYGVTLHLQNQTTYAEEYRVVYPDGQIRWLLSQGQGIYDAAGQAVRMVGITLDISERKALEQDLLQMNTELELRVRQRTQDLEGAMQVANAANLAKSSFLSNMSHELRTPLNAILGFSQLLSRDLSMDADQKEQIDIINRSGEHLLKLINNILELSKIEAGRASLVVTDVDLGQMLQHIAELFRVQAAAKGLNLVIQSDPGLPPSIQIDESKLRQVLINLLSNAIKFTQEGQITLRVRLGERPPQSRAAKAPACLFLYFAVQDQGPGLAAEEQALLFRPFQQTQAGYTAQQGTGLGLSISYEFVRMMGGELCVTSASGEGATFWFQIPVVPVGSRTPSALPARRVVGLAPNQPAYRVLVVEDSLENCQFLTQLLRSVGFEVQTAENGQVAVALWQQWRPQLIWMDIRMPVVDGYEATRQIRALEATGLPNAAPTKIIALTASVFKSERAAILEAGCDDLVCKPAVIDILFDKMSEHLGTRYIYSKQNDPGSPEQTETTQAELLAELQTMPSEWVEQLHQAARILDEALIMELLDQIPPSANLLADALKEWVAQFQFEKLIQLTTQTAQ